MQIDYLADEPELGLSLIPALLEQWREFAPEQTWELRAERLRGHKALDLGFHELFLFTLDQQPLCARLGWATVERTVWRGRPVEVMVKPIA